MLFCFNFISHSEPGLLLLFHLVEEMAVGDEKKGCFIFLNLNVKVEAIYILVMEIKALVLEPSGPHSPIPGKLNLA